MSKEFGQMEIITTLQGHRGTPLTVHNTPVGPDIFALQHGSLQLQDTSLCSKAGMLGVVAPLAGKPHQTFRLETGLAGRGIRGALCGLQQKLLAKLAGRGPSSCS